MNRSSILVGKVYRTADGELRRVTAMEGDEITYTAVAAPSGPGILATLPHKKLDLEQFAREADGEESPRS